MYSPTIHTMLMEARVEELRRAGQPVHRSRTSGALARRFHQATAALTIRPKRSARVIAVKQQFS